MGVGIIDKDFARRVYAATSWYFSTVQEPMVAEANTALRAVGFSQEWSIQRIILEGDYLQVVNTLNTTEPSWSIYR
jgi:hypothetical protein